MPPSFHAPGHDHANCVAEALRRAERRCSEQGVRLTPQRQRVLEIVWSSHAPIGAYAILERLTSEGGRPAPMTVYRALDFLQAQGLVHRVAGINAFVGCSHPENRHDDQFLLCVRCGAVAEIHDPGLAQALDRCAEQAGFRMSTRRVELEGVCRHCSQADG